MLRDGSFESQGTEHTDWSAGSGQPRWRVVDAALRQNAESESKLLAEQARWLREAEQLKIWRELGYVSMLDYLERVCGYAPRTASDRMRVARALGELPGLEAALASGRKYTAIRELTRVATPATEDEWLAWTDGMSLRAIEEAITGLEHGDLPGDRPDPKLVLRTLSYQVTPPTYVRSREARAAFDQELGRRSTDDEYESARAEAMLGRLSSPRATTGRAKFQIALTVCGHCKAGWQHGAGAKVAVDRATIERAHCDAVHITSADGEPVARATQKVPPRIVKFVWHRDAGRCQVPGCRSARNLELHHLEHREHGGGHHPSNIILICDSCHAAHHRGAIVLGGRAPDRIVVVRPHEPRPAVQLASAAAPVPAAARVSGDTGKRRGALPDNAAHPRDGERDDSAGPSCFGEAHRDKVGSSDAAGPSTTGQVQHHDDVAADSAAPSSIAPPEQGQGVPSSSLGRRQLGPPAAIAHADSRRAVVVAAIDVRTASLAPSRFANTALHVKARDALVGLGWKPSIARAAVDEAGAHVGDGAPLENLIREALRRCPKPRG